MSEKKFEDFLQNRSDFLRCADTFEETKNLVREAVKEWLEQKRKQLDELSRAPLLKDERKIVLDELLGEL